jgi:hypothetical protein
MLAMEEAEEITDGVDAVEVETNTAEIEEEGRNMEDGYETIDDAMGDVDTLEDISDAMQDSIDEGTGMDEDAAEIAQIATEAIYRRLGIRNARSMPSLESYSSVNSRLHATRIAQEGIMDSIQKAMGAVSEFTKQMTDNLSEFYKKVKTGVGGLKKSAEELKAKAEAMDGSKKLESKGMESLKFGIAFSHDNKPVTAKTVRAVVANSSEFLKSVKETAAIYAQAQTDYAAMAKDFSTASKEGGEDQEGVRAEFISKANDLHKKFEGLSKYFKGKPLMYRTSYFVESVKGDRNAEDSSDRTLSYISLQSKLFNGNGSDTVDIASPAEIAEIAQDAIDLATELEAVASMVGSFESVGKKMSSVIDALASSLKKQGNDKTAIQASNKELNWLKKEVISTSKFVGQVSTASIKNAVAATKQSIRFGNACLKQYRAEK